MKYLFIDDDEAVLRSWRRALHGIDTAVFAKCHSVEEALHAVARHEPDVIFLDHSLTDGGNEGLEIAEVLEGRVKIYSTTVNSEAMKAYHRLGIEHVGKSDLVKIRSIIAG